MVKIKDKQADNDKVISLSLFFKALESRSFRVSAATFVAAGTIWFTNVGKAPILSLLQPYAPAAMSLTGSLAAAYVVGWFARREFGKTIMITGAVILLSGLLVKLGVGGAGFLKNG